MAFKMTARAAAAPLRRTYECGDCGHRFNHVVWEADAPHPDCPKCEVIASYVPPLPGMLTTKSAAIDMAQKIAEEDFGLTNIRDNQRAGDVAAMGPAPMQTAEREAITQQMKEMADQMQSTGAEISPQMQTALAAQGGSMWTGQQMASLNGGPVAGAAQSADTVGILEKARAAGASRMSYNVMGADDMPAAQ